MTVTRDDDADADAAPAEATADDDREGAARLARINAMPADELRAALTRCCGAHRWVEAMLARHPYASMGELLRVADRIWAQLDDDDVHEAMDHHPRIGADLSALREKFAATRAWSAGEQAGAAGASESELVALRDANVRYEDRFGHIFIICATGLSAGEMRAACERRLANTPRDELRLAAGEIGKITALRLEKL